MPLTAATLPGLQAQGTDGMVALVSAKPSDAKVLLLRNRSKQTWKVTDEQGARSEVPPGRGVELADELRIDFGGVAGTVVRDRKQRRPRREPAPQLARDADEPVVLSPVVLSPVAAPAAKSPPVAKSPPRPASPSPAPPSPPKAPQPEEGTCPVCDQYRCVGVRGARRCKVCSSVF